MAAGPAELAIISWMLLFFGGSGSLPVGVPLPPDAGLQSAAPPSALLYISHSGNTTPDPKSTNQVEKLLAEPEVQGFLGEARRLIDEVIKLAPKKNEREQALAASLPVIGKAVLSRPSMFYLSDVKLPPDVTTGNAAFVISSGDQTAALVASLEELERLIMMNFPPNMAVEKSEYDGAKLRRIPTPPGLPPVVWGVKGEYVFIAVGEKESENVVDRLTAKKGAPKWLTDLHEELGIKRTAGVIYLNTEAIIAQGEPILKEVARMPPPLDDVGKLLDLSGLRHLRHVAVGAGLDDNVAVSKLLIAHDGKPEGLLNFGEAKPLTVADFKLIPKSADFAVVGRFNIEATRKLLFDLIEKIDPNARKQLDDKLDEAQEQLGFSLDRDLFAGLGDTWTVYNSSEEGGLLLTGLCASVTVRDRAKVEKVLERVLRLVEAELRKNRADERSPFAVRKTEVDGKTISYIQVTAEISPVAPAWCFVDDRLVVALSPQMVRTSISRPDDEGSLGDVPEVVEHLKSGDVTSLSYSDTTFFLRLGYSYAQYLATLGASALEKELGIKTDITKFPSLGSIRRHMRPAISVTRQTKTGILFESYATGASIDVPLVAGVGAALLVPAVAKAGEAARVSASINNMRNIQLALLMYEGANGKLPPRVIKSADGKPLLSWRVAILPYLDEQALHQQFRLNEPWDSEHNKKLLTLMPRSFAHPAGKGPGSSTTQYQIPAGKGTLFDTDAAVKLSDGKSFPEGTSNTALIVETAPAQAVAWTKPDDVTISADEPGALLNQVSRSGEYLLGMADGSVQRVSRWDSDGLKGLLFPRSAKE
jgi:type II secretory pathway pseudopilin PulG